MAVKDRYPDALIQFEDFQTDMVRPIAGAMQPHVAVHGPEAVPERSSALQTQLTTRC